MTEKEKTTIPLDGGFMEYPHVFSGATAFLMWTIWQQRTICNSSSRLGLSRDNRRALLCCPPLPWAKPLNTVLRSPSTTPIVPISCSVCFPSFTRISPPIMPPTTPPCKITAARCFLLPTVGRSFARDGAGTSGMCISQGGRGNEFPSA